MQSIEYIKGSDGSANASVATVQNSRSPGATTIDVDTVLGINGGGFMGSMGTPHTFTDPITGETITVISEETAVDFSGHVDGTNLEIDDIAPGYVDGGSDVGDIVIIRPTTQWSDNIAEVLEVAHNDDGTLKDDAVTTDVIDDGAVTTPKLANDSVTFDKAGPNAIYDLGFAGSTPHTLLNSTSFIDFATVTATSHGEEVELLAQVNLEDGSSGSARTGVFRVVCDGVDVTGNKVYYTPFSGFYSMDYVTQFRHTPAAGAHTWKLQVKADTANATFVNRNSLSVKEIA